MVEIAEPESERGAGHSVSPEDEATNEPLGALIDRLLPLSEDQLYAVLGAYEVTPDQHLSAALLAYAPGSIAASLEGFGFGEPAAVDVVALGRRTAVRVIEDWGDYLRPRVCPLWRKGADEKDLALVIAGALLGLISVLAGVLAVIGVAIARYLMKKLCEEESERVRMPAVPVQA